MEAVSVAEWAVIVKPRSRAEKIRFIRNTDYAARRENLNCKFTPLRSWKKMISIAVAS
jgi:hypothetical protein